MLKFNSTLGTLLVAAAATAAVAVGIENWRNHRTERAGAAVGTVSAMHVPRPMWEASAPGRVEPRHGEVKIAALSPGRVVKILVRVNSAVKAGDLMVRLDDDEAMSKMAAATTEIAVRRRERDAEQVVKLAADRRTAEDAVSVAERSLFRARLDLDQLLEAPVSDKQVTPQALETARSAVTEAAERIEQERANLRKVQALAGMPLPTRLDSSLATARADLSSIEATIERARLRAPSDGVVLQVNTHVGEIATPSPEDVLLTVGDLSQLRVRAEIEERDITKIRIGQAVVVRSDTFPGLEFAGRVDSKALSMGAQRLAGKGPRRPTDVDVLQVVIKLDNSNTTLLPGMRVDVFFKPDNGKPEASAKPDASTTATVDGRGDVKSN